jgi:hypothetical protein
MSAYLPDTNVLMGALKSALAWYNTDLSLARQAGRLRFEYAVAGC